MTDLERLYVAVIVEDSSTQTPGVEESVLNNAKVKMHIRMTQGTREFTVEQMTLWRVHTALTVTANMAVIEMT
jgi:hypothetical protein